MNRVFVHILICFIALQVAGCTRGIEKTPYEAIPVEKTQEAEQLKTETGSKSILDLQQSKYFELPLRTLATEKITLEEFQKAQEVKKIEGEFYPGSGQVWFNGEYLALVGGDGEKESNSKEDNFIIYKLDASFINWYYRWEYGDFIGDAGLELVGIGSSKVCIFFLNDDSLCYYDLDVVDNAINRMTGEVLNGNHLVVETKDIENTVIDKKRLKSKLVGTNSKSSLVVPKRFDVVDSGWDGKEFYHSEPKLLPLKKMIISSIDPITMRLRWDVHWVLDFGTDIDSSCYIILAKVPYTMDDSQGQLIQGEVICRYPDAATDYMTIVANSVCVTDKAKKDGNGMSQIVYDGKAPFETLVNYMGKADQYQEPQPLEYDPEGDNGDDGDFDFQFEEAGVSARLGYSEGILVYEDVVLTDPRYEVDGVFSVGIPKEQLESLMGPPDRIEVAEPPEISKDSDASESNTTQWRYFLTYEDEWTLERKLTIMHYYGKAYIDFTIDNVTQTIISIRIGCFYWLD